MEAEKEESEALNENKDQKVRSFEELDEDKLTTIADLKEDMNINIFHETKKQ